MSGALHIAGRLAQRLALVCGDPALAPRLRVQAGDASLVEDGDLDALMRATVRFVVEAEQHAKAQKAAADAILAGQKAAAAAAKAARAALLEALEESGAPEVLTAYHAAQLKPRKGKVVVLNLDALPTEYVKVERVARLDAIGTAMDAGEVVPGAIRSNGGATLEIRVRTKEIPA